MYMKHTIVVLLMIAIATSQGLNREQVVQQGQAVNHRCIQGCLTYSRIANQCQECQYNYVKKNNICVYSPSSATANCCAKFDASGRCVQCPRGLILNTQTGLCVDQKIAGCIQKNQRGCTLCETGYTLVGARCVRTIPHCLSYDSNNVCLSCHKNTVLFNGVCILKTQVSRIPQCNKANQFGCYECFQGYRPSNGVCVPAESLGCLRYNQNGQCTLCQTPFYTLDNGVCLVTGCLQYQGLSCIKCNSAFGFILASNRCQIPNCIYFGNQGCTVCKNNLVASSLGCRQPNNKVCIICKNDQYLSANGQCLKKSIYCSSYKNGVCVSCIEQYFLDRNNVCKLREVGCVYNNGRCQSCRNPFTFFNNACVIPGCLAYNQQGCTRCHQKLILNNAVCTLPFCSAFNRQFVCTQCVQGYELNQNGKCLEVDPFCQRRNSLNRCVSCKPNYTFNAYGRCVSLKVGCNYVDGRCTSCRSPFVYIPESQSCFIDGCLQYFIGGCAKCQSSYKLLYNSCKLPNCLISQNGKCLQCDPDFVFNSKGLCVSKDQFCDQLDQNGVCVKCMNSYFYSTKLQKCVKKSQGCIYNNDDQCYACDQPFTFDAGRCVIAGCLTYSNQGCTQCLYPYLLSKERTCFISNCVKYDNKVCVQCQTGYSLNNKNLCVVADSNCIAFNQQGTKCTKCIKGYRLDQNNRCQYADQFCNFFDRYGLCANCDRLYFVNPQSKCQLRDPQCLTYTNGYCSRCKPYHFVNNGICFANLKGCVDQRAYGDCRKCDRGYDLEDGVCKAEITKLSWNSVDMDFGQDCDAEKQVFNYNMTNKLSLIQAIRNGNAQVFYSSSSLNNADFQIDTQSQNGWAPSGKNQVQFIGVKTQSNQIFYAFEIKPLTGCQSISFNLQYSFDGVNYDLLERFTLTDYILGVAKTYYIKPIQAKFIRLVLTSGSAHFKVEFYYSNPNYESTSIATNTFISRTVTQIIDGLEGGISECLDSKLCWAGVQACQPTKLGGFQLIYTNDPRQNQVNQIKINYSLDGIKYTCYDNCKAFRLVNNKFVFQAPLLAQKVHVHFTGYVGHPKFGIKFNWLY